MGNTWTVDIWGDWGVFGYHSFQRVYGGESLWAVIRILWSYRKAGFGCIKVEWHPRSADGKP